MQICPMAAIRETVEHFQWGIRKRFCGSKVASNNNNYQIVVIIKILSNSTNITLSIFKLFYYLGLSPYLVSARQ